MDQLAIYGKSGAIYRGQARKEWTVIPSGYRDASKGVTNTARLDDWKWRAARFASPLPQDDVEWLVMAQHYGLATPLLDWTTSPLIALFFACEGYEHIGHDGCVWISDLDQFDIAYNTLLISPFGERKKPFAINGVGRNVRSTAQDSILTLHAASDPMNFRHDQIFLVPSGLKIDVMNELSKLGISADRLLYDINHLVSAIKAGYKY
ncbi:FRG domain-containing protein [uncultured Sphingomonas sp.]|uniref:FRG domain-containing protein n=1 Tax=uncultured Sphingomonas sp. TaxID=158754 RepID=UPI0025EA7357|nr:FRG domain-containing protein [uncultured Sphingomonas sp.]